MFALAAFSVRHLVQDLTAVESERKEEEETEALVQRCALKLVLCAAACPRPSSRRVVVFVCPFHRTHLFGRRTRETDESSPERCQEEEKRRRDEAHSVPFHSIHLQLQR